MTRRLRIAHLVVQPVLVWDDAEEMEPGPTLNPVTLPLSKVAHLVETLPAEVAALAAQLAGQTEVAEQAPTGNATDANLAHESDERQPQGRGTHVTHPPALANEESVAAPADILTITLPDGRLLLRIGPDGEVDGAVEDMGEAASIFVQHLRELTLHMGLPLAPSSPPVVASDARPDGSCSCP